MQVRIEKREQQRPKHWKKYLRNDQNKSKNVKFLLEDWSHPTCNAHLFPPANFFNCPSQIFRLILKDGLIECVSELISDQEEADTKVFCVLSTQKHLGSRLLVCQQWIPILQYTWFFTLQISIPMYIEIGTSDRRRCIDICNVVSEIRKEVFLALPAFIRLRELITRAPFTESVKLKR